MSKNTNVNGNAANDPNHFEGLESRTMMSGTPSATDSALAYDVKGNLHVAYYDVAAHNLKYTMQSASTGAWSTPVVVDKGSKNVGQQVSLALDKNGLPGVAYRDVTNQDLKYAHFDGKKWTVSAVDTKQNTGINPSLAFDKTNHALISYYRPTAKDLQLATSNGKSWTFSTIAKGGTAGQFSSVAINPATGKASVAFEGSDGKVRYVDAAGKGFTKPVVIDTIAKSGSDLSLSFGTDKKAAFSYYDPKTGAIKLAVKSKKGFAVTTVASVNPGQDPGAKVVINPATGKPQVVFYDAANDGVFVADKDGNVDLVGEGGSAGTPVVIDPKTGKIIFTEISDSGTPDVHDTRVIPNAPSDVDAEAVSATRVDLTWSDNSDNEAGFLIERSSDGGVTITTVATTAANVTSYSDTTAVEGTDYLYRITAIGSTGVKVTGDVAEVLTLPAGPTNAVATGLSATSVSLSWVNHAAAADGYVVERSYDGGVSYMTLAELPVGSTTYVDNAAVEGLTYTYRVTATNDAGSSVGATASVTTLVSAPMALTATSVSAGLVNLSWTDTSAHETGYVVQRSANGVDFTTIGTLGANAQAFADSTVAAGAQYTYRVKATGAAGSTAYATSTATQVIAAAPVITATTVSVTQVNIAWSAVTGAATYIVERSDDGGDTFNQLGVVESTSYADTSALESSTYQYRVRAVNAGGESANSNVPTATTFLAAPSDLSATAASAMQIDLTWTDNSNGETGFVIERSDDGGDTFTVIHTSAANSTSYSDTTAAEGAAYVYRIHGVKNANSSDLASTASATTPMVAPTGLTAVASSLTQVDLAWADNSSSETGYEIYRSTDGGTTYTLLHTTAADATAYSDTSAVEASTYSYKVRAVNAIVQSGYTSDESATTKPAAPTSVAGTVVGATQVDLSWADNSSGETGYRIERNAAGAGFVTLQSLPAGTTSFSDTTATEGVSYTYRVFAMNDAGDSAASNSITAVTLTNAPSSLVATVTGATSVHLTWTDNSTVEAGFIVERSPAGDGSFTAVSTLLGADAASFDDTTADAGTAYDYRVLSVNSAAATAASNTQTILTLPDAATGVVATVTSATALDVTWTAVTGASSYLVERSDDAGSTWTTVGTPTTNAVSDTGATEGGTFVYRVTSHNATGDGAVSGSSTGVTTIPAAPTGLVATPVSVAQIDLTWTDNSAHETGYSVERSDDNGTTWNTLDDTLAADTTTYSDTTTSAATNYEYRVIAMGTAEDSAASNVSTALTVPAAPGSAGAIASADTHVSLSWSSVAGATGYAIDRSDDGGSTFTELTTVGNVLSYNDLTAAEATSYVYQVRATNATGSGVASSTGSVTTLPAAATNLTKTVVSATRVDLAWTDNSGGETGYLVERSSNGGTNYTPLTVLAPDSASYSDTAAVEGTSYVYRVKAVDITGTGAGVTVNAITIPAAPTVLAASPINDGEVDLTWNDNSAAETSYVIERSDDAGTTWTTVTTTAASATSYNDTSVSGGVSYQYRVHAVGAGGSSALSNVPSVLTIPARIFDLATTVVSDTQIDLAWSDVNGETGYLLESSTDGGSTWNHVASPAADDTSYSDTGLSEGTQYMYRIVAVNGTGANAPGNFPSAYTSSTAPDTLVAIQINAGQVNLTWNDNSSTESGYVIERSDNGGDWAEVTAVAADSVGYHDTSVTGGVSYEYRVFAIGAGPNSAYTNVATALTIPAAPTNVVATVVDDTHVALAWDAMDGADSYLVEVSDDAGSTWSTVGTPTDNSITDAGATEASAYAYRVTAVNTTGSSDTGASNAVLTLAAPVTDLAATPVDAGQVDLAWSDPSAGESGFRIERSTDGSTDWAPVHTTAANAVSWSDTTVSAGTTYYYRIYAIDATGDSAVSNVDHKLTHPGQVTNLTATPATDTLVTLQWDAVDSATSYLVEVSDDAGSTWSTLTTTAGTVYGHSTAVEATAYVYRVTASNGTGDGVASATQAATTYAALPTGLTVTPTTATNVDVSWTDHSAGETGFLIERSDDGGETWNTVHTNAADAVSWSDATVTGGNSYIYRVSVTDATGASPAVTGTTVLTVPGAVTGFTSSALSTTAMDWTWDASQGATGYLIEVSTDAGSTWSTVTTINDGETTTFHDSGLTEGTAYLYQITAIDGTGNGAASSHTGTTLATAASTLAATPISNAEVDLTWADNSSGETGYKVRRSDDGGETWTTVHTTAADATGWNDTTVTGGVSYQYEILATDAGGDSDPSNLVTVLTFPDQVNGLNASCPSATEMDFVWTAVTGADSYTVQISTDGGSTWTTVDTTTDTQYAVTGLTEGSAYDFQIFATNATGDGDPSADASVGTIPATPTDLTATATGATSVDLAWTDNSAHETGYDIYRSTDGGTSWTNIHTTAADATSWTDAAAPEDLALQYKVVATGYGDSADSNVADATTPIAAPTSLTSTATGPATVTLNWTDNSSVETGYKVERSDDGGSTWTLVTTTAAGVQTFGDTGLTEDVTYTYRVTATDGTVDSDPSNAPTAQTALIAPTSTAAVSTTATQVDLTWDDNSSAESGYKVERSDDGGSTWNVIATTAADATSYSDTTAVEGSDYQYRVRAADAGNFSAYDNVVSLTTIPAAPTSVSGSPFSTTQIDVTWADNSAHESGYVVERSTDGGTTWTDIHTTAADATGYSDTGLTEGTDYQYRVRATSGATADSLESTASATVATNPTAPTSLTSTVIGANEVDLAWVDNSDGETTYVIERSTDNGSTFTALTSVDAGTTSYQDTSAAEATEYVYRVRAERNGSPSAWSNSSAQVLTNPAAVSNFAVATPTSTRAVLTWTDNSSGETGYNVMRSTDGGSTWSLLNTTVANATSYSDNTVTEGGSYSYRVTAFNTTGESTSSDVGVANMVPTSPTGASASAVNPHRVDLAWTDRSNAETGFKIERSTNGGATWTQIDTVVANVVSYSDTTVNEGTNYQYRVRAYSDGGNSGYTATVSSLTPLVAPSGLTPTVVSATRVDLAWVDNSSAESQYKVERSADGGSTWSVLATVGANVTTYSDTTGTEGHAYQYRVRAARTGNTSAYSSVADATTLPAAPSVIVATVASDTQVNLTWTDNSAGETGFIVERFDGTTWTQVGATLAANATSYSDTTATEGSAYSYRVQAVNDGGSSAYSTSSSVTTLPAAPTVLAASSPFGDTVELTWTDNSAHETGYKVERSDDGGSTWNQIGTTAADGTFYADFTVDEGGTYQYRVRGNLDAANSAYSNTQTVTTVPLMPSDLAATTVSATQVDLTWTDNSAGETSYKIERSDDGGQTFTEIASVAADTTTYSDMTASEGIYYQYRIRAHNAGGYSGYSDSVEALTMPADPSDMAVTATFPDEIDLAWTDNSVGEDGFILERQVDGGGWALLENPGPDVHAYADYDVTTGHTYDYRVRAYNSAGESGNSNTDSATI